MPKPTEISMEEWKEIINLPQVIEAWELDETETPESFSKQVYGAKFTYPALVPKVGGFYVITDGDPAGISIMIQRTAQGLLFFV
jgi:hypothetical protein